MHIFFDSKFDKHKQSINETKALSFEMFVGWLKLRQMSVKQFSDLWYCNSFISQAVPSFPVHALMDLKTAEGIFCFVARNLNQEPCKVYHFAKFSLCEVQIHYYVSFTEDMKC